MLNFSTERASASKFKPIEVHNNKRKFLKIGHYTIVAARIPTMLTLMISHKTYCQSHPELFFFYLLYLLKSTPDSRGIIFISDFDP